MKVRRLITVGVGIALISVLASACSSSSSSTTPSASSTSTGTPINVGNIGSYTGAQASSEAGAQKVLTAWAKSVNDNGGINGHPVNLIIKDLGNNVTGGLAAAKELVEQDKVVAIVGEEDNADSTWAAYIAGTGVPVIGGLPINITMATNPAFFPAGTNVFSLIYGTLVQAKKLGGKFGFLYCAESPQCASAVPLYQAIGQAVGVQVVVSAKVSGTAPDYTAVCQQLKDAGVQSYQVGSGSAVVARVATACATAGVTAKQLANDGTATESWTSVPALDGTTITEAVFPFVSTEGSGPQAYQALLAKYLPDLGDANGPNAAYAFVAGSLFEKAAAGAGATITPATLKTALYSMKNETLGGLAPPLTFTEGKPTQVNCYFTMGLSGGKFTTPDGNATQCAPDALVGGILAQLAKSAG